MAIRVEGPDAARRVCGNLPAGGSREDCFKQIDYALADVAQSITNCDAYIDRFARILCGER